MKHLLFLCGVILIIQWHASGQEAEYLKNHDFQVEKKRMQESIYKLNKSNHEMKSMLLMLTQANDSMANVIALQSSEISANREAMKQLETNQTNLDSRLLTQRKSGTLIAILVPVGLFLFILMILIWLMIFRHRTLSMFNNVYDRSNEFAKQLEDQLNTARQEHEPIRSEIRNSVKQTEALLHKLSSETAEKLLIMEKLIHEEKALHDTTHQQSHEEYEVLKGSIKKDYDSLSKDLAKIQDDLANTAKDFTARLKETIRNKREDK